MTPEERQQHVLMRWLDCQLGAETAFSFLCRYHTELSEDVFREALVMIVAAERETCAMVAEESEVVCEHGCTDRIAAAIRAKKQPTDQELPLWFQDKTADL